MTPRVDILEQRGEWSVGHTEDGDLIAVNDARKVEIYFDDLDVIGDDASLIIDSPPMFEHDGVDYVTWQVPIWAIERLLKEREKDNAETRDLLLESEQDMKNGRTIAGAELRGETNGN